ncbi:FAS1 domain-containing protein [Tanacetum coccineum]
MRRGRSKSPIAFIVVIVSVSCFLVLILSVFRLPDVSLSNSPGKISKTLEDGVCIGKFGEMMIEMLPQDLSFTVFVPSEVAFERDLGLRVNDSLLGEKANDTYAILTRVLSFTVVPWKILSQSVPYGEEMTCDSLSGFKLYVSKDVDEMLVVNRVRSKRVDLGKGEIVVHVMDGVIMEAEFEQSVRPDDDEED